MENMRTKPQPKENMISIEHPYLENLVLKQYEASDVSSTSVGSQRPWYLEQLCSIDTLGSRNPQPSAALVGRTSFGSQCDQSINPWPKVDSFHWLILQKSSLRCKPNMRQQGPKQQRWIALLRWWQPWLLAKAQSTVSQPKSFEKDFTQDSNANGRRTCVCHSEGTQKKSNCIAIDWLSKTNQTVVGKMVQQTHQSHAHWYLKKCKQNMRHLKPRMHLFNNHAEIGSNLSYGTYIDQINPKSFRKFPCQIIGLQASKGSCSSSLFQSASWLFISLLDIPWLHVFGAIGFPFLTNGWLANRTLPPACWQALGVGSCFGFRGWQRFKDFNDRPQRWPPSDARDRS